MIKFIINNDLIETNLSAGTVLLDFIRDVQKLPGTKEACREGECGACTVLIGKLNQSGKMEYKSCASCILPIGDVADCHIVTVEGLEMPDYSYIQQLIIDYSASQCGFCTPGIILSLTGFCFSSADFNSKDALNALDGNICRCTGYVPIRTAAKSLAEALKGKDTNKDIRTELLVEMKIVPETFLSIPEKLTKLQSSFCKELDDDTVVVAGATDLFVQQPDALETTPLYFMSKREDLNYIKSDSSYIYIGGSVTLEDYRKSIIINKYFPSMEEDILLHSSTILRNKATLTGNIVNASPIGDITIMLLALDAILVIENNDTNTREVKLSNFYKAYKEFDLKKNEIIKEIRVPIPQPKFYYNFEKVSNRKILDIASVNSAIFLKLNDSKKIEELKISAGGVGPIPLLLKDMNEFYGKEIDAEKISDKCMSQITPIDDIRGSAKYKKLLLKQLVIAHFINK